MKADGHTGKDIAKFLGVGRATLYRYLTDGTGLIGRSVEVGRPPRVLVQGLRQLKERSRTNLPCC